MKINTNAVGNYSPYNLRTNNVKQSVNIDKAEESKKTDMVSKEEKNFFAKMYPENKNEIIDYHFYKSSGKMSGVSVGSLFDKRG
ncbi:MAG: hypothetical protein F9K45_04200 [Melioribacteraceae bacterium]|nr:MAG: hypothetical protein F9K45_04200 [Melioribacteraceae bacterium]